MCGLIKMPSQVPYNEIRYRELFAVPGVARGRGWPDALRAKVEAALTEGPWTVTQKQVEVPSGDPHDYFSLSRYYHPNPDTPDGLPYILRDGQVNPDIEKYDYGRLARLVHAIQLMSIAFEAQPDSRIAALVNEWLRVWFVDSATRMHPHMKFAQYIPGTEGVAGPPTYPPRWVEGRNGQGCYVSYGGSIEGCCLPLLLDALRPFTEASALEPDVLRGLQAWFADFRDWLLNDPLGQDERNTRNNHALWYRVQVVAYAVFTGQEEWAKQVLAEDVPVLLDAQMAEDGSLPEECWRAIPQTYILFALSALFNLARLSESIGGPDIWQLQTSKGRSLCLGARWFAQYLLSNSTTASLLEQMDRVQSFSRMLLTVAAQQYEDPCFVKALATLPPWGKEDERKLVFEKSNK